MHIRTKHATEDMAQIASLFEDMRSAGVTQRISIDWGSACVQSILREVLMERRNVLRKD